MICSDPIAPQYTDPSGMVYLRARYYNPAMGMFTQPDPVMGVIGERAVRWNPYMYVGGNPVNITDPSGEFFPLLAAMAVGAAVGATAGGGLDLAMQMADNVANGRGAFECLDMGQALRSALGGCGGMTVEKVAPLHSASSLE